MTTTQPGTPNAKENSVPRRSCPNRNGAASGRAEGRVGVSSDFSAIIRPEEGHPWGD